MRIAICEDDLYQMDLLKKMINQWASDTGNKVEVFGFQSAEEFTFLWQDGVRYDLAFLDIQLGPMNGMELARYIRKKDKTMMLVFSTGVKDFLVKGYEVKAYRYLLKPLKEEAVRKTLTDAKEDYALAHAEAMVIPNSTASIRVFKNEIYYFQIENHYVTAHTLHGDFRFKEKLSNLEPALPEPHFCRCHRSFIINLHHTGQVRRDSVDVDNGDVLPVSRNRWASLNECFIAYYANHLKDEDIADEQRN